MDAADPARELLRHAVATVAYRASKAVRGAPPGFADFTIGEGSRTPVQILAHMGDLCDWVLHLAQGKQLWSNSVPLPWDAEVGRFFTALTRFDDYLASGAPLGFSAEKLLQGAVADALTHIGQLNLLRRRAGAPVKGESYFSAEIVAGRAGAQQAVPRREFD